MAAVEVEAEAEALEFPGVDLSPSAAAGLPHAAAAVVAAVAAFSEVLAPVVALIASLVPSFPAVQPAAWVAAVSVVQVAYCCFVAQVVWLVLFFAASLGAVLDASAEMV